MKRSYESCDLWKKKIIENIWFLLIKLFTNLIIYKIKTQFKNCDDENNKSIKRVELNFQKKKRGWIEADGPKKSNMTMICIKRKGNNTFMGWQFGLHCLYLYNNNTSANTSPNDRNVFSTVTFYFIAKLH